MMEAARRALEQMRGSPDAWHTVRYERVTGPDGYDRDGNAARRAAVLWALQYDHRVEDLALVRWLAEQEARCRREAPFQGLTEETELAGFLLALLGQVEDVWRQWEIKRANFDTWCGYDVEHLAAAGVQRTIAFVRGSEHSERDDVLERLLGLDEEDLSGWWESSRSRFPADPDAEDPLTWIGRAKLADELDLARRWLDRWAAGRPRDKSTLSELRYQLADLGAFDEAAAAQREALAYAGNAWDSASGRRSLAELERRAGHHDAAWEALRACRRALDDVPGWSEVGLGRMYVEELFLLAGAASAALTRTVFDEADRQAGSVGDLPLVVLRAAAEAAEKAGRDDRARHYRTLRDAEQRRIEAELPRF
ncbi:hypothetical protein [Dactylosporangium darangshiense]|uniref:Tetratricopeptide repeat protein n=1 Tax=Dactylosporangium darangshiense TaxID=579108 RepID=A0ABP8DNZ9_9ACTN